MINSARYCRRDCSEGRAGEEEEVKRPRAIVIKLAHLYLVIKLTRYELLVRIQTVVSPRVCVCVCVRERVHQVLRNTE